MNSSPKSIRSQSFFLTHEVIQWFPFLKAPVTLPPASSDPALFRSESVTLQNETKALMPPSNVSYPRVQACAVQ